MLLRLFPIVAVVLADGFLYLHPANPRFHPSEMYPIQRNAAASNDKVRDLPQSGIIYLHRIKPLGEEFKRARVHGGDTFTPSKPLAEPVAPSAKGPEDDYNFYDDLAPIAPIAPSTSNTTLPTTPKRTEDLSEESEQSLDKLLQGLTSEEKRDTIKVASSSAEVNRKSEVNYIKPTRVEPRIVGFGKNRDGIIPSRKAAKVVGLSDSYNVGSTAQVGSKPDFDPWERVGQRL